MDIETERNTFEEWRQSCGFFKPARSTEPGYTDEYENPTAQAAWMGWKARAAVSHS